MDYILLYPKILMYSYLIMVAYSTIEICCTLLGIHKINRGKLPNWFNYIITVFIAIPQYVIKILIKLVLGKTVIISLPMMLLTRPFRLWSRRVVYNYCIYFDVYLDRLNERRHTLNIDGDKWLLRPSDSKLEYNIKHGEIRVLNKWYSLIMFPIANAIWVWHDDDCEHDITTRDYNTKIYFKQVAKWLPKSITDRYRTITAARIENNLSGVITCNIRGRYFDVGDLEVLEFGLIPAILWNIRNGMYNFNYMYEDIMVDSYNHFYKLFEFRLFKKNKVWHFGYIKGNVLKPQYNGRAVWTDEDLHRLDTPLVNEPFFVKQEK